MGGAKGKHVAVYCRVSSKKQDLASQLPDLKQWVAAQDEPVKWYKDKQSGKTMDRPSWHWLEKSIKMGKVSKVVVWRLDRLGRTASGLTALFDDLQARKVGLVSLKDGIDLSTPAGRLMANVLASVAAYETEVRGERVLAGQAVARAAGKRWGGRKKGTRIAVTIEKEKAIRKMLAEGTAITEISKVVGISRQTIYTVSARKPS